jgi:hypothetical protein
VSIGVFALLPELANSLLPALARLGVPAAAIGGAPPEPPLAYAEPALPARAGSLALPAALPAPLEPGGARSAVKGSPVQAEASPDIRAIT